MSKLNIYTKISIYIKLKFSLCVYLCVCVYIYIKVIYFSFLSRGIILWIELPWPENLASTCTRHTKTLDSCFNLIRSHQHCIPWSSPLQKVLSFTQKGKHTRTFLLCQHSTTCYEKGKIWISFSNFIRSGSVASMKKFSYALFSDRGLELFEWNSYIYIYIYIFNNLST